MLTVCNNKASRTTKKKQGTKVPQRFLSAGTNNQNTYTQKKKKKRQPADRAAGKLHRYRVTGGATQKPEPKGGVWVEVRIKLASVRSG